MTFDEMVLALKANQNTDESFIGVFFNPDEKYFGYYEFLVPDPNDPDWIGINFEGGFLFNDGSEQESYSFDDLPDEAKMLNYRNLKELPFISGLISEFALFKLFPSLPDPDDIWTDSDKSAFVRAVTDLFQKGAFNE